MNNRLQPDSEWVHALAAKLRASAPQMFAPEASKPFPRSAPAPVSQAAREPLLVESDSVPAKTPLSSVMRPFAESVEREQKGRREAAQREADDAPVRAVEARVAQFAASLKPGTREVLDELFSTVREEIAAARAERDEDRLRRAFEYLDEGREFCDEYERGELPGL